MVVLPIIKLGTLALKMLSKPIANTIKKEAGYHPLFRKFIIDITQANYRVATNVQRRIYGRTTNVAIRPLDEEKAIKTAAIVLGETFMFTVAGAATIYEIQNSIRESRMKEERHRQELQQAIKAELASAIEHIGKQAELHARKQVDHIKQVELHVKQVEHLVQKQAERGQQLVTELSQKQEQLAAEHSRKQELLAAELAQKQELLAAKLAQQFAAELAQKQEQLVAELSQKQEHLTAELAAKLVAEFNKEKRQLNTFFVIFDAHSCQ